jgi:hypothetical protein
MKIRDFRAKSFLMVTACLVLLLFAGCGGGGGGGGNRISYISISGKITFDFVPATQTSGLDYSSITQKPARGVVVEAIRASDSGILDSTTTDSSGNYTVSVPVNTDIIIRVKAQMLKTGIQSWDFQVVDNTNSKALYVMDNASFNSGTANITDKNLNAHSGWGGSSYSSSRVAAPFVILDTVYKAVQKIITADPTVTMPQLLINWSVNNVPTEGDETSGQIGTTYYDPIEKQIYILGAEGNDTDEYDDHVIAHEWGHYFEDRFSRSDSIGGDHSSGDKLDPRVAFSEGFSNAFSGMATDDPYYVDTSGFSQRTTGVFMDLENNNSDTVSVGWFSEESVQSILYDLYDSTDDGVDTISLGFSPIYDVLVNEQKNAESFTTIFSFTSFLKNNYSGNSTVLAGINKLLENENITTTAIDEWDSTGTETNDGGNPKSLPVYTKLTYGNPAVQLCGDGQFGNYNKLMNRRFFYFAITSSGSYSITAVPDVNGNPVINLYSQGLTVGSADNGDNGVTETLTVNLTPGYYVGEIYEWGHVNSFYTTKECFDVSLN